MNKIISFIIIALLAASFAASPLSAVYAQSISVPAPSGTLTSTTANPIAPSGAINDTTPTYSWSKVTSATQYQYQLFKGTALVYTQTVASSACGTTANCINTPTKVLPFAAYSWRVHSMVNGIWQAFSAPKTFTIVTMPILIAPSGVITDPTPTYSWYRVSSATQYEYQLYKSTGLVYAKTILASACGASTCAATPTTTLGVGTYTWKVRAMLAGVWKTFSAVKTFILTPGFHSEFTKDAAGWIPQNGTWTTSDGFYITKALAAKRVSSAHVNKYATFTYEVKLMETEGPVLEQTLYLRGNPAPLASNGYWQNGYEFSIRYDGYNGSYRIAYMQNGNLYLMTGGEVSSIKAYGYNTLKVTMNGTFAQFFVNGVRVAYGNNFSLFRTGQVGIGDWSTPGRTFYVDYATLSTSAPASSPSSAGINLDTVSPVEVTTAP